MCRRGAAPQVTQLKSQGYMNVVFTFVDATHLIAKSNFWKERDKAQKDKYDKLNNEVLPKVACDKQARIGAKSQNRLFCKKLSKRITFTQISC